MSLSPQWAGSRTVSVQAVRDHRPRLLAKALDGCAGPSSETQRAVSLGSP